MSTVPLSLDQIYELAFNTLKANGCDDENAKILSTLITNAERDGSMSHGLFRLPAYVSGLKSGKINGKGRPEIKKISSSVIKVDGKNCLAPMVLNKSIPDLITAAKENGVAVLAITNSHHMAAMWPETEMIAEQGLVAFACTSYKPAVAPSGAKKPLFGTNPISFAWPRPGMTPVVYDMATASMAMGEVQVAKREGHKVPLGTGLSKEGKETTDPAEIADGGVLLRRGAARRPQTAGGSGAAAPGRADRFGRGDLGRGQGRGQLERGRHPPGRQGTDGQRGDRGSERQPRAARRGAEALRRDTCADAAPGACGRLRGHRRLQSQDQRRCAGDRRDLRDGPQELRSQGLSGHVRGRQHGPAAQGAEEGHHRHDPHLRCAHVRHRLWHRRPAHRARGGGGRAPCDRPHRGHDRAGCRGPAVAPRPERRGDCRAPRRVAAARAAGGHGRLHPALPRRGGGGGHGGRFRVPQGLPGTGGAA